MTISSMFSVRDRIAENKPRTLRMPSKFADMTEDEMNRSGRCSRALFFIAGAISSLCCGAGIAGAVLDRKHRGAMIAIASVAGTLSIVFFVKGFSIKSTSSLSTKNNFNNFYNPKESKFTSHGYGSTDHEGNRTSM